jgi:hypothetical protein
VDIPIKWKLSPYFNKGREGKKIDLIIIHSTEGGYQPSIDWLCNPKRADDPNDGGTSAHYVIKEDGSEITQLVKDEDTGWHAGNWGYNLRAIGIEHSWISDGKHGMPDDKLYRAGAKLVASLCQKYAIPADRQHIISHGEVPPPNTHTDPGKLWDWDKFMKFIAEEMALTTPQPPYDPNPNKLTIGSPVLAEIARRKKVAATNEQIYQPDPSQNGLLARSFTWDTESTLYVAFQQAGPDGKASSNWTVQVFKSS